MEPHAEPLTEQQPPSRRRRWPLVLAALAVVLALVAGGSITWIVTGQLDPADRAGRDGRPTPAASASGRGPATDAAIQRHDAITELLVARGRAVLARDRAAFLALIDPAADGFRERQATVFDRLAEVPFAEWEYDFAGEGPPLDADRAALLPEGSFVARVTLRYTFRGSDSPVESQQFLTVVPRRGAWLLAGDRDDPGSAQSGGFGQDIWELGPVNVVRGRSSLVIGEADRPALREYARQADRAVRDVGAVWKRRWSRRPVVIVPRTQADMARIVGTSRKGLEQIAAVTTGYSVSGPTQGDRVVINPAAWRKLAEVGQRVVMAHEVTHLATRAVTYTSVPIWLAEGFADYVAYAAVEIPARVVAEDVLELVRKGKGPRQLPGDTDFDASRGDIAAAYESSWLAAQMIADRHGERKLVRLYVVMADAGGNPVDQDTQTVLGISEDQLVKDWRAVMKSLARG